MRRALGFSGPAPTSLLPKSQRVHRIEWGRFAPSDWHPDQVPEVGDVRPSACPSCAHPAVVGVRICLHGHGTRTREVVVGPVFGLDRPGEPAQCWVRRYRCVECKAGCSVLPPGVMPRFLYSAAAIVMAFFMVEARPAGDGLSDREAYRRQGMYACTSWNEAAPYRWRSIGRWLRHARRWWPERADWSLQVLLNHFVSRSAGAEREGAVRAAVAAHVTWGHGM